MKMTDEINLLKRKYYCRRFDKLIEQTKTTAPVLLFTIKGIFCYVGFSSEGGLI